MTLRSSLATLVLPKLLGILGGEIARDHDGQDRLLIFRFFVPVILCAEGRRRGTVARYLLVHPPVGYLIGGALADAAVRASSVVADEYCKVVDAAGGVVAIPARLLDFYFSSTFANLGLGLLGVEDIICHVARIIVSSAVFLLCM